MRSVGSDYDRLPHTGTTRYVNGEPTIPSFALAAADADQLSRLVGMDDEPIRLRLSSSARTYETTSQNVIGDIVGDERPEEIIVLGSFAPITIFSTKFTDSLTGNAKLAGFSLTVTAIISLAVMTVLHALLPGA